MKAFILVVRWSIIAAQLPGRTDNDIKNYWNTKLKKKLLGIAPSQRTPHQQPQQQKQLQQQLLFPSSSSSSHGSYYTSPIPPLPVLESLPPISQDAFGTVPTSTTFPTLLQGPSYQYQMMKESGHMIMFGSEQSCSSSDGSSTQISYGKEMDYSYIGRGGGAEQMGLESYLCAAGIEETHRWLLGGGGGGGGGQVERDNGLSRLWEEAPLEYNYEEIKQLLGSLNGYTNNNGHNLSVDDPTGSGGRGSFKSQGRVM